MMRVICETAFNGYLRGKLLSISKGGIATVKITSRGLPSYKTGSISQFYLRAIFPAEFWKLKTRNFKIYAECIETHSRDAIFAPYMESL